MSATRVMVQLTRSARIKLALGMAIDEYAADLDRDPNLRAVRVEVRCKPNGDVRAVIVDRQSELSE